MRDLNRKKKTVKAFQIKDHSFECHICFYDC